MLDINFINEITPNTEAICAFIDQTLKLDQNMISIDQQYQGLITAVIKNPTIFTGKFGQTKVVTYSGANNKLTHIILVGIGDEDKLTEALLEEAGGKALQVTNTLKLSNLSIIISSFSKFSSGSVASFVASGAFLGSYRFNKYRTTQKPEEKIELQSLDIITNEKDLAKQLFVNKKAVAEGVFFARDCISEPPNVLYPESYAEIIAQKLEPLGINIEILGEHEMRSLGMGALIGVGQGSAHESQLVVMHYHGCDKKLKPVVLVGKGVTFDSGGISLKPSAGMADMKYDMSGSATVVGLMKTLALRKAKVNVVGVLGLVENMPGSNAQRPSDIVTTMSGKTAEVLNTDAEGRLVLADAIWYAQDKYTPACVIDIATLTGAIVIALGHTYAGLFSNNDELAEKLIKSGNIVNEKFWRMPLHKDYDEMIKSDIADVANISNVQGAAGASTGAHFIGRFIKDGNIWAHIDIAGMAWDKKGKDICPKGAVGYGVRALNQFIQDYYEEK